MFFWEARSVLGPSGSRTVLVGHQENGGGGKRGYATRARVGRDGEVTFLLELSYCYSYYHVRNYSSGKFL